MSGLGPFTAKGRMTQDFGPGIGPDNLYINTYLGKWWRGRGKTFGGAQQLPNLHLGVDIAAPEGSAVLAPEKGTVLAHGFDKRGGYYILLGIQKSTLFYAGHLSAFVAKVGAVVPRGATIAKIGHTGLATGPHTHAAIRHTNAVVPNWHLWYSDWFAYNPQRLQVGGDMSAVEWIKPR
jgi:murein DD-endopeptidase MepM/ murein hydrolase activator NlpD